MFSCGYHQRLNFPENGFWNFVKLLSLHCVMKVVFFHQVLDVHFKLDVTWKNFSLSLDVLHELNDGLSIFGEIAPSRSFLKVISIEFIHSKVQISTPNKSLIILIKNIHFFFSEAATKNAEWRVAKIEEKYIPWYFRIEVSFSENTIIQRNSSRFVN